MRIQKIALTVGTALMFAVVAQVSVAGPLDAQRTTDVTQQQCSPNTTKDSCEAASCTWQPAQCTGK